MWGKTADSHKWASLRQQHCDNNVCINAMLASKQLLRVCMQEVNKICSNDTHAPTYKQLYSGFAQVATGPSSNTQAACVCVEWSELDLVRHAGELATAPGTLCCE